MEKSIYIFRAEVDAPGEAKGRANLIRSTACAEATLIVALGGKPESFQINLRKDGAPKMEMVSTILDEKIDFIPNFKKESLTVSEIVARARDEKWLAENPQHPITRAYEGIKTLGESATEIKEAQIGFCFPYRGYQVRLVRGAEDQDKQRRLLKAIGMSEAEAEKSVNEINNL